MSTTLLLTATLETADDAYLCREVFKDAIATGASPAAAFKNVYGRDLDNPTLDVARAVELGLDAIKMRGAIALAVYDVGVEAVDDAEEEDLDRQERLEHAAAAMLGALRAAKAEIERLGESPMTLDLIEEAIALAEGDTV